MDRGQKSFDVLVDVNKYRIGEMADYELIKSVCAYYDCIKNEDLSQADLKFLKYIAGVIGIPHLFDLLGSFNDKTNIENFDLNTFSTFFYESTLHTSLNTKVHKYQNNILKLFQKERINRFFLSASTSFGKTYLVYEIIKKMDYKNVVLIFPTIALLSENLERIIADPEYKIFKDHYYIHTLSDIQELGERNIFIFTPERFLSFMEKQKSIAFDFAFVDEIYKLDNEYIIDEETKENERDVAYRIATFYTLLKGADVLLAGPYIEFSNPESPHYNGSFHKFLKSNNFELADYNRYEIVNKNYVEIKTRRVVNVDNELSFTFDHTSKESRLLTILSGISYIKQNSIIYCATKPSTENYASKIINSNIFVDTDVSSYESLLAHIRKEFSSEWVVYKALLHGVGIHHGLVPKYLQKEIVALFNRGHLHTLLSTTTITEGVNTAAKNLIVLSDKKGIKDLKKFDAKNIAGRAGRFLYHYSGRVITLQNKFIEYMDIDSDGIKHKNYDLNSPKDEIDLFYTEDDFLKEDEIKKRNDIEAEQRKRNLDDEVFDLYKVVSRMDKIFIYDKIKTFSPSQISSIKMLIQQINFPSPQIHYDGFQLVIDTLLPVIKNKDLRFLIEYKGKNGGQYSMLTHLVYFYLQGGFVGSMRHKISQGEDVDTAIRQTAKFVYDTLKYHVVKYIGVFNIMYKYHVAQLDGSSMDQVSGLDRLLLKLEYNAFTEKGRIASDYGVPANVIKYYEYPENSNVTHSNFDSYEKLAFEKVERILNKQ